jgi:hypothetical protein
MPDESPIDRIYKELGIAIKALQASGEISAQVVIEDHARKALLLSVASHFEHRITGSLRQLCMMAKNSLLTEFAVNKAVFRQYHALFQWKEKNLNSFFGLFGTEFKQRMMASVRADLHLDKAIKAFLELGNLRNQLVHQDYATFPLEKTSDEIYRLYQDALYFVDAFHGCLDEFVIQDDAPVASRAAG